VNIENQDSKSMPLSKFEWRSGDVEIDTPEETAAALAEDARIRAEQDARELTSELSTSLTEED